MTKIIKTIHDLKNFV